MPNFIKKLKAKIFGRPKPGDLVWVQTTVNGWPGSYAESGKTTDAGSVLLYRVQSCRLGWDIHNTAWPLVKHLPPSEKNQRFKSEEAARGYCEEVHRQAKQSESES